MSEVDPPAPAGWYPDGQLAGHERYWDGQGWTEYFHPVYFAAAEGPVHYLNGAPCRFLEAITSAIRYTFAYRGRASRSAYWWFQLAAQVLVLGLFLPLAFVPADPQGSTLLLNVLLWTWVLVLVAAALASLSLTWRRLQDSGTPGWLVLLLLVPFGSLVILFFALRDSTPGPNQYTLAAP